MTGKHKGRLTLVESHEEESCRLFDQAIYTYLISCRIESSFRVELSDQASQPDPSSRVQLLNPTRHFFKKIPTQPELEYSTRRGQSIYDLNSHSICAFNTDFPFWYWCFRHLTIVISSLCKFAFWRSLWWLFSCCR